MKTFLESEQSAIEFLDERSKMVIYNFTTQYDTYEVILIDGVLNSVLNSSGKDMMKKLKSDKALFDYIANI